MKKEKKPLTPANASIWTLAVIVVTLGVTLPLHFVFPDNLTTYWVIAICVAVISPFALINFKVFVEAKGNYTEEQKKNASAKFGIMMLSVWYADFTFICMFMNWLIAFFILAGLYLVKMVYDFSKVLVNRKDSSSYPNFLLVGDFILSFLLLIIIIYKIEDQTLQTIVIALSSALVGGLLTLLGVIMTINKSDRDRKEEKLNQNKPFFYYTPYYKGPYHGSNNKNPNYKFFGKETKKQQMLGRFYNSDKVEFLIESVSFNGKTVECTFDPVVSKGELFLLYLYLDETDKKIVSYVLNIEDVDRNKIKVVIDLDNSGEEPIPTIHKF